MGVEQGNTGSGHLSSPPVSLELLISSQFPLLSNGAIVVLASEGRREGKMKPRARRRSVFKVPPHRHDLLIVLKRKLGLQEVKGICS